MSLSWSASTDNVGVAGYRVFRNGTEVGTTATTGLIDDTAAPDTTYSYTVVAYDVGGNTSPASSPAAVTTPPDTVPPSTPTSLTATAAGPDRVDLAWTGSTDNIRLAGYDVLRDGVLVGTSATTSFADTTVSPLTTYSYEVRARDESDNVSDLSNKATVTTTDRPTLLTFRPVDDTYVRSDQVASTFGSMPTLQVDGSPPKNLLMRFDVQGIAGRQVTGATLKLFCVDSAASGGTIFRTNGAPWSEGSVTWSTQPGTGAQIGSLGAVQSGRWYTVNLGSQVTDDGIYDLKLTSASSDGADYVSDEGTAGAGLSWRSPCGERLQPRRTVPGSSQPTRRASGSIPRRLRCPAAGRRRCVRPFATPAEVDS